VLIGILISLIPSLPYRVPFPALLLLFTYRKSYKSSYKNRVYHNCGSVNRYFDGELCDRCNRIYYFFNCFLYADIFEFTIIYRVPSVLMLKTSAKAGPESPRAPEPNNSLPMPDRSPSRRWNGEWICLFKSCRKSTPCQKGQTRRQDNSENDEPEGEGAVLPRDSE